MVRTARLRRSSPEDAVNLHDKQTHGGCQRKCLFTKRLSKIQQV